MSNKHYIVVWECDNSGLSAYYNVRTDGIFFDNFRPDRDEATRFMHKENAEIILKSFQDNYRRRFCSGCFSYIQEIIINESDEYV